MVDLKKLSQIDVQLPNDPQERIERFAKDLAEGALKELWSPRLNYKDGLNQAGVEWRQEWLPNIPNEDITEYVKEVWANKEPWIPLMMALGYFSKEEEYKTGHLRCWLTEKAFALLKKESRRIFISYGHKSSSTLALFVRSELQVEGYRPFLDIEDIGIGTVWAGLIKESIEKCEIFIVVIGKETLKSNWVKQEITWAMDAKKIIYPILHNGITENSLKKAPFRDLKAQQCLIIREETSENIRNKLDWLKLKLAQRLPTA